VASTSTREALSNGPITTSVSGACTLLPNQVPLIASLSTPEPNARRTTRPSAPAGASSAQRLIEAGLVAAVPTALAGLNDWADSERADAGVRRAGMLHAAVNTSGLALYAASVAARRRGAQSQGRRLALAGLGVLTAGSYLGGHMSFRRGVGPNPTAYDRGPVGWTAVDASPPAAGKTAMRVLVGETPVLLVRVGDALHAIHDRCSHRGCSLASGTVEGHVVICRCHGSRFDVRDGAVVAGPATYRQPAFDVRTIGDRLELRLRQRP
jgi:nitrite reductase/ring-hydroxylating ferredoxin subunit